MIKSNSKPPNGCPQFLQPPGSIPSMGVAQLLRQGHRASRDEAGLQLHLRYCLSTLKDLVDLVDCRDAHHLRRKPKYNWSKLDHTWPVNWATGQFFFITLFILSLSLLLKACGLSFPKHQELPSRFHSVPNVKLPVWAQPAFTQTFTTTPLHSTINYHRSHSGPYRPIMK